MNVQEKMARVVADLTTRGMSKSAIAPPAYRLLWQLGVNVRPPVFQSFWTLVGVQGGFFGIFWTLAMRLTVWRSMPIIGVLVAGVFATVLFGVSMAAFFRWRAGKHALPPWEEYERSLFSQP